MRAIDQMLKKRAIKSYLYKLSRLLAKKHGESDFFFPVHIAELVATHKMSSKHIPYALALYANNTEFNRASTNTDADQSYASLRAEVGRWFMDGNETFTNEQLLDKFMNRRKSNPTACSASGTRYPRLGGGPNFGGF